jgi:hypothetical protein
LIRSSFGMSIFRASTDAAMTRAIAFPMRLLT